MSYDGEYTCEVCAGDTDEHDSMILSVETNTRICRLCAGRLLYAALSIMSPVQCDEALRIARAGGE